MSEFYFDYKCVALAGEDVKKGDKALDFFLYQDYGNGSMQVQVYVPPVLQKKNNYESIRLYNIEQGVGFPSLASLDRNYDTFSMFDGDNPICKENGFYIKPKAVGGLSNLSSTGIIAFVRKGNDKPLEEDCYKYAINYTKREVISYRVLEKKNALVFEIKFNRLLTTVKLNVIYKSGSKPLFIGDRKNDSNYLKERSGEKFTITLPKLGKDNDWKTVTYPFKETDIYDFRLVFEDEELNKFYILLDESDFTLEDEKVRRDAMKFEHGGYRTLKEIKCPYCNQKIAESVRGFTKGIITCQGRIISTNPPTSEKEKKIIVCDTEDKVKKSRNAVIAEQFILPEGSDRYPTMNIAVAGFPQCGKTVYLASLINMSISDGIYKANPFILNKIHELMTRSREKASYVEMKFINSKGEVDYSQENTRGISVGDVNIKGRYSINVGQQIERQTPADAADILAWNPIGFNLPEMGFTYFYDVPGEAFKSDKKLRTFDVADGIIAIINGDTLNKGDGISSKKNDRPLLELFESLKAIKKLANETVDLEHLPIAIVFTKLDLRISNYLNSNAEDKINACFDENCHNLREDMISLFPKNKRYKGSEIERHIDCSSYEISHYLKSLSEDDADIFNQIIGTYKNIKFFACSALGGDSVFDISKNNVATVKYRPRRLRVELPIVWLMHKKGLID